MKPSAVPAWDTERMAGIPVVTTAASRYRSSPAATVVSALSSAVVEFAQERVVVVFDGGPGLAGRDHRRAQAGQRCQSSQPPRVLAVVVMG